MKDKEIKEYTQILVDIVEDEGMPPESKYILYRQGFIAGALSVFYAQKNLVDMTDEEVMNALYKDLSEQSLDDYARFVEITKSKKDLTAARKVVKKVSKISKN